MRQNARLLKAHTTQVAILYLTMYIHPITNKATLSTVIEILEITIFRY